jgi:hypothetical protein
MPGWINVTEVLGLWRIQPADVFAALEYYVLLISIVICFNDSSNTMNR